MSERRRFVATWMTRTRTMSGLCAEFGISRECGYKWIRRFQEEGKAGLEERSRAPHEVANRTDATIEQELIGERTNHPTWGPKKLIELVQRRDPELELPAPSTVWAILKRHGLVHPRRRRTPLVRRGRATPPPTKPNQEWSADYKGQFRMKNGRYCYPLTIEDRYSRFFLGCRAFHRIGFQAAQGAFERVFREYGLPESLRTDNGTPFAGNGLGGLSRLSVWWIKLGIRVIRGRPAHPQDNGALERLHRTIKEETARPPEVDLGRQQRRFDDFRCEYNAVRPHEGIAMRTPRELYASSSRGFPQRLESPEYPGHYEVRRVGTHGCIKWRDRLVFVTEALTGEPVGLLEVDNDLWRVTFGDLDLGMIDERQGRSHRKAKRVSTMCPS